MSELCKRMLEDMRLAGLSAGTQRNYVRAVAQLARHYDRRPDQISEEEVRRYLIDLIEVKRAARGTYLYKSSGIRFFYVQTLGLDWHLFSKKKSAPRNRNVFRSPSPTRIFSNYCAR